MPIGTCTGQAQKDRICRDYTVTPVLHLWTLAGERKQSCAGGRGLGTSYYMFEARHRETGVAEIFYAGETAARGFLETIPAQPLPCFNPLVDAPADDDVQGEPGAAGNPREPGTPRASRTALNRELFQATRLFVHWLRSEPRAELSSVIREIDACPADHRNRSLVKSVNTMIGYYGSLRSMIGDLENRGNQLRHFAFPHIVEVIRERGLPNNIDP